MPFRLSAITYLLNAGPGPRPVPLSLPGLSYSTWDQNYSPISYWLFYSISFSRGIRIVYEEHFLVPDIERIYFELHGLDVSFLLSKLGIRTAFGCSLIWNNQHSNKYAYLLWWTLNIIYYIFVVYLRWNVISSAFFLPCNMSKCKTYIHE